MSVVAAGDEDLRFTIWRDVNEPARALRRVLQFNRLDVVARPGDWVVHNETFRRVIVAPELRRELLLHEAAAMGYLAQLEGLVQLDVGLVFRHDTCAAVALNGHAHVFRWMHAHRHEPFAAGRMAVTPEQVAYVGRLGHVEVLRVILEWFPECVTLKVLENAASEGHIDVVELLLQARDKGKIDLGGVATIVSSLEQGVATGHLQLLEVMIRWRVTLDLSDEQLREYQRQLAAYHQSSTSRAISTTQRATSSLPSMAPLAVVTNRALMSSIASFHERIPLEITRLQAHYRVQPGQSIDDCPGLLPRMAIIQGRPDLLRTVYAASLLPINRHVPKFSFASAMYDAAVENRRTMFEWLHSIPGMTCRPDTFYAVYMDRRLTYWSTLEWLSATCPESMWSMVGTHTDFLADALSMLEVAGDHVPELLTPALVDSIADCDDDDDPNAGASDDDEGDCIQFVIDEYPKPWTRTAMLSFIRHGRVDAIEKLKAKRPHQSFTDDEVAAAIGHPRSFAYMWALRDHDPSIRSNLRRGLAAFRDQPDVLASLFDEPSAGSSWTLETITEGSTTMGAISLLSELPGRSALVDVFKELNTSGRSIDCLRVVLECGKLSSDDIAACIENAVRSTRALELLPLFFASTACKETLPNVLGAIAKGGGAQYLHGQFYGDHNQEDAIAVLANIPDAWTQMNHIWREDKFYNDEILLQHLHPKLSGTFLRHLLSIGPRNRTEHRHYDSSVLNEVSVALNVDEVRKIRELKDPQVTALARHAILRETVGDVAGSGDVELLEFVFELRPDYLSDGDDEIPCYALARAISSGQSDTAQWLLTTTDATRDLLRSTQVIAAAKEAPFAIIHLLRKQNPGKADDWQNILDVVIIHKINTHRTVDFGCLVLEEGGASEKDEHTLIRVALDCCSSDGVKEILDGAISTADENLVMILVQIEAIELSDHHLTRIFELAQATTSAELLELLRCRFGSRLIDWEKEYEQRKQAQLLSFGFGGVHSTKQKTTMKRSSTSSQRYSRSRAPTRAFGFGHTGPKLFSDVQSTTPFSGPTTSSFGAGEPRNPMNLEISTETSSHLFEGPTTSAWMPPSE